MGNARPANGEGDCGAGLEFRPYMAVVMADFCVRHEVITAETEGSEKFAELARTLRQPRCFLSMANC